MSNPHVEGRTSGAAGKKFSDKQRITLIKLARQAYSKLRFTGEIEETLSFDDWRHRVCKDATERPGFSFCHNEDFLPVKRHLLKLLGLDAQAEEIEVRMESEPRTWAMKGLEDACTAAADVMPQAMDYAGGFLRRLGMDLENATDKGLWRAMYCVQRKTAQLRRRTKRQVSSVECQAEDDRNSAVA